MYSIYVEMGTRRLELFFLYIFQDTKIKTVFFKQENYKEGVEQLYIVLRPYNFF